MNVDSASIRRGRRRFEEYIRGVRRPSLRKKCKMSA